MRKIAFLCSLLFLCGQLLAQTRTITGKVLDDKGMPVPGATIQLKGGNKGVSSDESGNFTISVGPKAVLVISSINFTTQEVHDLAASPLVVNLKPGKNDLAEVVVVAYGTQKKTDVTGAVSAIKGNMIEDRPIASIDQAIQGLASGVQVSAPNGIPGSAVDIRIRGIGSLTNSSQSPLWVIDGNVNSLQGDLTTNTTSANALSALNPDDVESISILKDAAATALYGSQAANGVIIVTTKSGKAGKTRINFSTEIGRNNVAYTNSKNRPMNTPQYQTILRQAVINAGLAPDVDSADKYIIDPNGFVGLDPNWTKTNTDWIKVVTRTGVQQQYNLSLSGGNDKTQYYASGGYFNQEGTTIATYFKRYNGSVSLSTKASDNLTFKVGISGSSSIQHAPPGSSAYSSPVSDAFFLPPFFSPYNADGSLRYHDPEGQFPEGANYNPLVTAQWNKYQDVQTDFRGYVTGEYQIIPNLKFKSNYSAEYLDVDEYSYWNPLYGDGSTYGGLGQANDRKIFNWTWTNQFNYRLNLTSEKDFYIDLLAATEAHRQSNNYLQATGQAFPQTVKLIELASAGAPTAAFTNLTAMSINSYFGNAILNYKDRYVLSGSYRRDGSSIFAENHKWGGFYSVGASWNINEEEAFKNALPVFNLLKLRASYGGTGNTSGFGFYDALPTYAVNSAFTYGGVVGSFPHNIGNSSLTWEKIFQTDIGLDFGLWKDRLSGSIDYYNKDSRDLLIKVNLSPTAGFSWDPNNRGQLMNVGKMYNRGFELTLNGRPIVTKEFTWDVSFNISHNMNKVTKLYNHSPISYDTRFNITEGHNIYEFYTRKWAGADPANGDPLWYADSTGKTTTNNSAIVPLQLTGKTAMPKYFGSFTNTFTYKGLSLQAQFYYNFGNYIYSTWENYFSSEGQRLPGMGQLTNELRAWQKPGDHTDIPRIVLGGNKSSNRPSTRYLYKGDYIRLRNVQLGYSLPKDIVSKAKISSLMVYVRGTNLLTFATDKNIGIDPELGTLGIADLQVFMPKSFTAGIKLGF
jgi:TonB-linked SusC/RagA family outer membrane protein